MRSTRLNENGSRRKKKRQEEAQNHATVNEEQMFDPLSYLCE